MGRTAFALALLLSAPVAAAARTAPLEIRDAWTRATPGASANAAVFMTITSKAHDRLLAASTPVARKTELMTMASVGGAMEMAYLKSIDLPADKAVSLDPSGLHVWLAGLKQPLEAGRTFTLTLQFEKAGRRQVTVTVIRPGGMPPMSGMKM